MRQGRQQARLLLLALCAASCGRQGPALRTHISGLKQFAAEAEAKGAMLCAPRQLAVAHAELRFAELELDQGFPSKATTHLARAELNARAAHNLSDAAGCAEARDRSVVAEHFHHDDDGTPRDDHGSRDDDGSSRDDDGVTPEKEPCLDPVHGCPGPDNDLDRDLDGVPDSLDQCPDTPGQKAHKPLGCPLESTSQ